MPSTLSVMSNHAIPAAHVSELIRLLGEPVLLLSWPLGTKASQKKAKANGQPVKPWPEDCLRHSFASYWLPINNDRPKLAEIMGNSTDVIREYYRKPIKPGVAEKYWRIFPAPRTISVRGIEI
jgi:hypothetical protein